MPKVMPKRLRDLVIPAVILFTTGISAAWTISSFISPMPTMQAQAVEIVSAKRTMAAK